jgi:hypothetical protein
VVDQQAVGLHGHCRLRLANIEMKDENGNNLTNASGENATADYSGFMGRVGVVMYFPTAGK